MNEDKKPGMMVGSERSSGSSSPQSTSRDMLTRAVDLANHAPSLYNAQPWSWQVNDDGADLFMDAAQSFPTTDPDKREMRIGCGAALHHLQVAVAASGWRCAVQRSSGLDDGLLASVRLVERCDVDPHALRLVEAIPRRHTDRRPFSSERVSEQALAALQRSADDEGVHLQIVTNDEHRIWLSILTERAAALRSAQEGYPAELAQVTGTPDDATHIPLDAVPHVVSPRHSDVTLRDFELVEPGTLVIAESAEEHPVWCIVWTDHDGQLEWLQAGEALSRLLLDATDRGLASGIQSQPVEVAMIRAQINEHILSSMGHAQVLVRIGFAGSQESQPPRASLHG